MGIGYSILFWAVEFHEITEEFFQMRFSREFLQKYTNVQYIKYLVTAWFSGDKINFKILCYKGLLNCFLLPFKFIYIRIMFPKQSVMLQKLLFEYFMGLCKDQMEASWVQKSKHTFNSNMWFNWPNVVSAFQWGIFYWLLVCCYLWINDFWMTSYRTIPPPPLPRPKHWVNLDQYRLCTSLLTLFTVHNMFTLLTLSFSVLLLIHQWKPWVR